MACNEGKEPKPSVGICVPCDIGFYKDDGGVGLCKTCGQGRTTGGIGSTSIQECNIGKIFKSETIVVHFKFTKMNIVSLA